jgi:hypothetical protein
MKRQKAIGQQAENCIQKNTPKHPYYNTQLFGTDCLNIQVRFKKDCSRGLFGLE